MPSSPACGCRGRLRRARQPSAALGEAIQRAVTAAEVAHAPDDVMVAGASGMSGTSSASNGSGIRTPRLMLIEAEPPVDTFDVSSALDLGNAEIWISRGRGAKSQRRRPRVRSVYAFWIVATVGAMTDLRSSPCRRSGQAGRAVVPLQFNGGVRSVIRLASHMLPSRCVQPDRREEAEVSASLPAVLSPRL